MKNNTKPIFEAKHRQIRASVFENAGKDGKVFYNTQVVRRFQSAEKEWINSSHFTGESDLVLARNLIDQVLDFLKSVQQAIKQNGQEFLCRNTSSLVLHQDPN